MAIQAPQITYLKGYEKPDLVGKFAQGFDFARNLRDEEAAGDLIRRLYGLGQPGPNDAPETPLDRRARADDALHNRTLPQNEIVRRDHAAATGATDFALVDELSRRFGTETGDPMSGYREAVAKAESGGDPNARSATSSASGLYGFTNGTWNALASKYPDAGLSADGITDPGQQNTAFGLLTRDNMQALRSAGLTPNPTRLYALHNLGAPDGLRVLQASADTPLSSLLPAEAIEANPYFADMTAGDYLDFAAAKGTNGNGGYAGPRLGPDGSMPRAMRQVPKPGADLMAALFANRATRPLAAALLQQQGKTVDMWQSFTGEDGKPYQINLADGKIQAIGGGGVTINNGGELQYDKTSGELLAKQRQQLADDSRGAVRTLGTLNAMEGLMADPKFYAGFLGAPTLEVKRLVSALGLDPSAASSMEQFNSLAKSAALDVMGGSLGSGFSNADRDFVELQVPNLGTTIEGNKQLIGVLRQIAQRKIDINKLADQYAAAHDGRLDRGWESYLADWAEQNPLFAAPDDAAGADGTPTLDDPLAY